MENCLFITMHYAWPSSFRVRSAVKADALLLSCWLASVLAMTCAIIWTAGSAVGWVVYRGLFVAPVKPMSRPETLVGGDCETPVMGSSPTLLLWKKRGASQANPTEQGSDYLSREDTRPEPKRSTPSPLRCLFSYSMQWSSRDLRTLLIELSAPTLRWTSFVLSIYAIKSFCMPNATSGR